MANILPFYLVCDESYSMKGEPLDTVNQTLEELHYEIGVHPVVCDKTRFGVIGFSDSAQVIQPLSDMSEITELQELAPRGETSYAAAFKTLKSEIENDVATLKSEGHRVFRPCAFFLSDGLPTDATHVWITALQELIADDNPLRPNMLAFGIGDADSNIIAQVGHTRAFTVEPGISPVTALKEFARALTQSIISSGQATEKPQLMMPEVPKGFRAIDTDEL